MGRIRQAPASAELLQSGAEAAIGIQHRARPADDEGNLARE
jgi:hypothetical protein